MKESHFHPIAGRRERNALVGLAELFHQDFDLEFDNVADGLKIYAESISSEEKEKLSLELEQLLRAARTDDDIRRVLVSAGAHNTVPNADLRSEFENLIVLLKRGHSVSD